MSPALKAGLRLILAGGCTLAVATLLSRHYVELWLPIYKQVIVWLVPDYRIAALSLQQTPTAQAITLTLELARPIWVGAKSLPAGFSVSSSTLQGHAMQHLVIVVSTLFSWPFPRETWKRRGVMLVLGLFGLAVVEMLDIPFMLVGSITDLLLAEFAPGNLASSWVVPWIYFLDGGGRLALSLAAALIAIAVAHRILPSVDVGRT